MNVYEPVHPKLGRPFRVGDKVRFHAGERMPNSCCDGSFSPLRASELSGQVFKVIAILGESSTYALVRCTGCGKLSRETKGFRFAISNDEYVARMGTLGFIAAAIELEPVLESENDHNGRRVSSSPRHENDRGAV